MIDRDKILRDVARNARTDANALQLVIETTDHVAELLALRQAVKSLEHAAETAEHVAAHMKERAA